MRVYLWNEQQLIFVWKNAFAYRFAEATGLLRGSPDMLFRTAQNAEVPYSYLGQMKPSGGLQAIHFLHSKQFGVYI